MSSTRLEPACAVIQNVVSIIAEQRSLRWCYFYRSGPALAAVNLHNSCSLLRYVHCAYLKDAPFYLLLTLLTITYRNITVAFCLPLLPQQQEGVSTSSTFVKWKHWRSERFAIILRTLIKDVSKFEKSIQYTRLQPCIPINDRTSYQALIKLT